MTALTDAATFAHDALFRPLLAAGLVKAAIEIMAEDESTAHHEQRVRLARRIITNPEDPSLMQTFQWVLSTNPQLVSEWLADNEEGVENDLAFVLSSVYDAVALA